MTKANSGYLMSDGSYVSEKPKIQSRRCHLRPIHHFRGESKTQQSFKSECDINNIMARYHSKGILPDLIKENPAYGDFTNVPTYLEACNTVNHAKAQFEALSSRVRAQFDNDPALFLEFASNPANSAELVKLGLATEVKPTLPPEPQKVIVVNPEAPEPTSKGGTKSKSTPPNS